MTRPNPRGRPIDTASLMKQPTMTRPLAAPSQLNLPDRPVLGKDLPAIVQADVLLPPRFRFARSFLAELRSLAYPEYL